MIQLRDYQLKQIAEIRRLFAQGKRRIIMQAPTGAGKTVMFSFMVKQASDKGLKCLILTDRIELLKQAGGTFGKTEIDYQVITAETKHIPNSNVLVAMVETIKRRCKTRLDFQIFMKNIDLLIIDEAHKHTFNDIFNYLPENVYLIGATATPVREGSKNPLCDFYDDIALGANIEWLISNGYLAKPKYYGVDVDVSEIKMKAGEFDEKSMEGFYSKPKLFEGLQENLERHAKGLKTMIFCPSVQSSINIARDLGALHIDGTMSKTERAGILHEFENTPGSIITNVGITTTGYDHPGIECGVLYRATTSLPLYLQMIGRTARVTRNKNSFKILDFGMNVQRFGYWHLERQWSLDPPKQKEKKKKDVFPVRFCPECGAVMAAQKRSCMECGFVFPVPERERVFAELQQLTYDEAYSRISKAETIQEMEDIREAKGYKIGWLLHKFDKYEQFVNYAAFKGYNPKWAEIQAKNYNIAKSIVN